MDRGADPPLSPSLQGRPAEGQLARYLGEVAEALDASMLERVSAGPGHLPYRPAMSMSLSI
jgi:hypothetical protein